jgi:hypothetical protein
VTQPDHSGRRSPRRRTTARTNSTHPTPTRPGGRRGGDRRAWPTAPTTTRVSPAKPATGTSRTRSQRPSTAPTPATVWTAGSTAIDLHAVWPAALVERVVTSFSEPATRVVLLGRSTPDTTRSRLAPVGIDGVIDHAPGDEPDPELTDAVAAVGRLGRSVRVEHLPANPSLPAPASRPFWTDVADGSNPAPATAPVTSMRPRDGHQLTAETGPVDGVDLVIASLSPQYVGDHSVDLVALHAAHLLRLGGILVVLTHCDWTTGELIDPTGLVVAAGQNADLLYLQHIVALHTPIRCGRFHLADPHPQDHLDEGDVGDSQVRARHRALVRGLPAPHRRIHSDLLVFAQPHDRRAPLSHSGGAVSQGGVLR